MDDDAKQYFAPINEPREDYGMQNCMVIDRNLFAQLFTRSLWVDIPDELKRVGQPEEKLR